VNLKINFVEMNSRKSCKNKKDFQEHELSNRGTVMRLKHFLPFVLLSFLVLTFPVGAANLSKVFKKVNPAVVVILTKERGYGSLQSGQAVTFGKGGLGSGIVISKDGLVMTAAHVVQVADTVMVRFLDGSMVGAKVLGSATQADVALLQLNEVPDKLAVAELGDSDYVNIGDEIFVIGAPYGVDHTLTVGYMSGRRHPEVVCNSLLPIEFLQTDAAINKGNSGGPMFSMDGKVIGIVSHILSYSGGSEGLGFAVSINTAKHLLLEQGSVWTGLEAYLVSGALAKALNVPQDAGLLIQRVADDSPGQRLGLRPGVIPVEIAGKQLLLGGDIVLEVKGVTVSAELEHTCEIRKKVVGLNQGNLEMKVLRDGKVVDLAVPKEVATIELD
jgi:S1-C subfamily serine protease